jgi:xanthine dehydrogenase accessory factor
VDEVLSDIQRWLSQGEAVAMATVINTWGSAPRGVGAKMALTRDAKIAGSVSGGCVEGAVYEAGIQAIESGKPELLRFGVADETAFSVGLACGGSIEIFVRRLDPALFETLQTEIQAGRAAVIVTALDGPPGIAGCEMLYLGENRTSGSISASLDGIAIKIAQEKLEQGQSGNLTVTEIDGDAVRLFIDVISPPPVLVMVGGVHIAISLAALAKTLGYTTIVVDPRRAFGSQERFPHADCLIQAWPDEAFQQIPLSRTTAIAILTHDPKIDDPALKIVLNSRAFYIGVLGSQQTHEKRKQRLLAEGLTQAQLDRLHAPIGLELGEETPEEIALAILAEIVAARHGRKI